MKKDNNKEKIKDNRSFVLYTWEWEQLQKLGNGSATDGLRYLLNNKDKAIKGDKNGNIKSR